MSDLVAAAERTMTTDPTSTLIVPAGCDAMRRAGDLLTVRFPDRVFSVLVPRTAGDESVEALARDLERLETWLRTRGPETAADPDSRGSLVADQRSGPDGGALFGSAAVADLTDEGAAGGVLIVGGPLSSADLLDVVTAHGVSVAGVESCTSPDRARTLAAAVDTETPVREVAQVVLRELTCPRHETGRRREYLARRIDTLRPAGILYARLPFCDPGAYDSLLVAALAAEQGLPFLEVEIGYPFELGGPLRVRLEAFLETLTLGARSGDDLFGDDLFGDDLFDHGLSGDDPAPASSGEA